MKNKNKYFSYIINFIKKNYIKHLTNEYLNILLINSFCNYILLQEKFYK